MVNYSTIKPIFKENNLEVFVCLFDFALSNTIQTPHTGVFIS